MLNYFDILLKHARVIVALTFIAALAAALFSFAQPATYEATALIALAPATLSVPTSNQAAPYYLTIDAARQLPPQFTPAYFLAQLKSAEFFSVFSTPPSVSLNSNASDRSLIEISARGGDARGAADAANRYAEEGALYLLKLLIPSGDQADTALKKLQAAEQTLAKFSTDNGLGEYDLAKLRGNVS
ncbi:MAG: hypothetical protein HY257_10955, partial [Chloroflexi bacterium]|nr:hypothetical protein [Chloroflexota bacterium]